MLNLIFAIKFVHVLAAVALFMLLADRSGNVSVIAVTARFAVLVELIVMIPALALQAISGFPLASAVGLSLGEFWIMLSLLIYALVVAGWLAVILLEIRIRDMTLEAVLNRTPNSISKAMENSSRPPAMRNAASEMPSVWNSQSPSSAAPTRIAPAIMLARSATLRRALRGSPSVTTRNVGVRPTGSTTTKSVNSAETAKSSGIAGIVPAVRPAVLCANAKDSKKAWGNAQGVSDLSGREGRGHA
jgi:uncharacterized membrane protein